MKVGQKEPPVWSSLWIWSTVSTRFNFVSFFKDLVLVSHVPASFWFQIQSTCHPNFNHYLVLINENNQCSLFFCHQIILNIWANLVKSVSSDEKQRLSVQECSFAKTCLFCVVLFVWENKDILVKVLSFNPHFCLFHRQYHMLIKSQLVFNDTVTISSSSPLMLHSCARWNGLTSQDWKSFLWISVFTQSIKQHINRCFPVFEWRGRVKMYAMKYI